MKPHDHFPMFIDAKNKSVIVIGGGNIAGRRIKTLSQFSFRITVISDSVIDEISDLCDGERIRHIAGSFDPGNIGEYAELFDEAFMVLACTDDRETNARIGVLCRDRGIQVNVCDAQDESTFWFPALASSDELVMGLVGDGSSHETVRKAAAELRRIIEERLY